MSYSSIDLPLDLSASPIDDVRASAGVRASEEFEVIGAKGGKGGKAANGGKSSTAKEPQPQPLELRLEKGRSLLAQVTAALAVAEAAYEFEHRDLHWGNVLLTRNDLETVEFTLEGKSMLIRTFGLSVSIIDFTLSRINTGESVLFVDLSSDPELFKGPKGDKQKGEKVKNKWSQS